MIGINTKSLIWLIAVSVAHLSFAQETSAPLKHFSITVPPGSKRLEEHRFLSSLSYEDTKREFHNRFLHSNRVKPMEEISLPHVRTITYKNFDKNAQFVAINIYQNVQTGLTEIFFLVNGKKMREGKP